MFGRVFAVVAYALVIFAAFAGVRVWQEQTAGLGPVATGAAPEGAAREIAFIANSVGGTVSLLDVEARAIVGEIDVLPDGKKVSLFRDWEQAAGGQAAGEARGINYAQDTDVSPDGKVLYVARGYIGDAAAFDIASGALLWRVPIGGNRADHMTMTHDGKRLFVSALRANYVEAIDTATGKKVGKIVSGTWPHDNHMSADGARLYNASIGDMTIPLAERDNVADATDKAGYAYQIMVVDPASLAILERYRFDKGIRPIAITSDETMLYAQQSNQHSVMAYDLKAKAEVDRLELPVKDGVTEDDWDFEAPHHGLAMSPDGRTLCIAGRASDYVGLVATSPQPDPAAVEAERSALIRQQSEFLASAEEPGRPPPAGAEPVATLSRVLTNLQDVGSAGKKLSLIATVPAGDAPGWSEITEDGRYCIVTNTRSDDISIVSIADRAEAARVKAGRAPKHITMAQVPASVLEKLARQPEDQAAQGTRKVYAFTW
jgi:DNA-binding beta-propeller fold protein YncE